MPPGALPKPEETDMIDDPDREPGETFAPEDIGWLDFETRNVGASLKDQGVYRYATEGSSILLPFAIGDAAVECIETQCDVVTNYNFRALRWADMPQHFRDHHDRVVRGEAVWCATNAAFDRAAWNYMTADFPFMEPEHIIDAAVQFAANGLPVALDGAAKYVGLDGKVGEGKTLIVLFCVNDGATPLTHPAEWERFKYYAVVDVEMMRSAFKRTRQLPFAEWREYWAAERINERGAPVDILFAERCARLADTDKQRLKVELTGLTNGAVTTVDQVKRIVEFLFDRLTPTGRLMLTKTEEEVDEEGEVVIAAKYSLNRDRITKLLAYIKAHREKYPAMEGREELDLCERILQIRLYGGSKTPAKFNKIMAQHVDGRLMGQYAFNGAQQTGRFSSKGVQVHNLARDCLEYEADMIDAIHDGATYDELARFGDDTPVSRKLSLVIRPTFVAREGKAFVWSDFEQIEARVLPWLANTDEAETRLDVFRAVDNDPNKHDPELKVPDQYTRTAAQLSGLSVKEITKPLRQRGKVAELALGFGGGKGSLHSMGANYGMHFDDAEAQIVVDTWRQHNQWAVRFWGVHNQHASYGLWGAINQAIERPGTFYECGRVGYIYLADYLSGTLLCRLPSGRYLTYRAIRWERIEEKDESGNVVDIVSKLRFGRGYGRVTLWPGLAAENITQATAADLLRDVIVRMEYDEGLSWMPLVFHTHDELGAEVDEADVDDAKAIFAEEMRRPLAWTGGLPIMSDETAAYQYTKNEGLTW